MLNGNARKKFTSCGDMEAENLLERVLGEIGCALAGTELCVYLGGSYGRGDGGVRLDREHGVLYNDLDFFVFARKKDVSGVELLKTLGHKYEHELKVDVDFSAVMTVKDIKNNASRLMMQELKRGYHLLYGDDLLAEYLPEIPPEKIPFAEACRLLLNRGMGLLFAGEKIANDSEDRDFILRNIYKAILGAGDAMLIAGNGYRWKIADRLKAIENSDMPENYKALYREAVEFKSSPHRRGKPDMKSFWNLVRDFFQAAVVRCSQDRKDVHHGIFCRCAEKGELSLKNYIKYCIKSRSLPLWAWRYYTMPTVAVLAEMVYRALDKMPEKIDRESKLYQQWLIFN
ncbi:MAG: hypothetical protein IJY46_03430 [Lentisphaeria bacterium]|nr:hypothetical protein [Lentisphaeria bacterium]